MELIPGKKVVWLVTDSDLKFENHDEWTGTKLIFEISPSGNKTQVKFTYEGLNPSFQCYDDCSWGWTQLIQESLSSFIATGKGVKVFE